MAALSPFIVLALGALLIQLLGGRLRASALGYAALACCVLALGGLAAAQRPGATAAIGWLAYAGSALQLSVAPAGGLLLGSLLLVCGAVTAGGMARGIPSAEQGAIVYSGLLVLLAGNLLAIVGVSAPAALLGVGLAWLGSVLMQQPAAARSAGTRFPGLGTVALATALLGLGAAPQLSGGATLDAPWLAGCCTLMALGPLWSTAPSTPLEVRAPIVALGLPAVGAVLLLRHGQAAAGAWSETTTLALLLFGVAATLLGAWGALGAARLGDTFARQTVAQLASLAVVYGTARPEAGPVAEGLLAHALVTGTGIAIALGVLERAAGTDVTSTLAPVARPPLLAGLAYALAAASAVGLPPLLGDALKRVVVQLAQLSQPWLTPVLLAGATLLALSYLPALAAFFRRPARRVVQPIAVPRGSGWAFVLMLGLAGGGLLPAILWQRALGDPAAAQAGAPPLGVWLQGALPTLALLALLVVAAIRLQRRRSSTYFAGGERPDEDPGWALPFAALRLPGQRRAAQQLAAAQARLGELRERLTSAGGALEPRTYVVVVVIGLLAVLLLAVQ